LDRAPGRAQVERAGVERDPDDGDPRARRAAPGGRILV